MAPEVAHKLETEEIRVPQKDVRAVGKALLLAAPEQKEQIVSELKGDFKTATITAKKITAQSKPKKPSSVLEASLDDHVGDIPEVTLTESNSDFDAFLKLADRIFCPKCGRNALIALIWSCCGFSIDEASNRADGVENESTSLVDSVDMQVEEQRCENEEHAETVTADCAQKEPTDYSEMAAWIPPDNSSPNASKILRMFSYLLKKGEPPRADSLAKMIDLPVEDVNAYLESASWVRKDDSSQDGIVTYLPSEPLA